MGIMLDNEFFELLFAVVLVAAIALAVLLFAIFEQSILCTFGTFGSPKGRSGLP